jgi:hypothetical protein
VLRHSRRVRNGNLSTSDASNRIRRADCGERPTARVGRKHLGQLLVYAAGREANVVVWVSRQVTDEHRAVIDWLNQETRVSFWALEFELWQIGESKPAPLLNIVCEPNALSKGEHDSVELSGAKLIQLEFWKALANYLDTTDTPFGAPETAIYRGFSPKRREAGFVVRKNESSCLSSAGLEAKGGQRGLDLDRGWPAEAGVRAPDATARAHRSTRQQPRWRLMAPLEPFWSPSWCP